jgi:hypothetical protein
MVQKFISSKICRAFIRFALAFATFFISFFFISGATGTEAMSSRLSYLQPQISGDLDCSDYGVQEATERDMYINGFQDPYGLDRDNDGNACETLPRGGWWLAIPTALGVLIFGRMEDIRLNGPTFELAISIKQRIVPAVALGLFSVFLMLALPNWLPRSTPPLVYSAIGAGISYYFVRIRKSF